MSLFSENGFLEKATIDILLSRVLPPSIVVGAYEIFTGKKAFPRTEVQLILAHVKRADEEKAAILDYTHKSLQILQTSHSDSTLPVATNLNFNDLKSAVHSTTKPIELMGQWLPHLVENTASKISRQQITRLTDEINELIQLRQALLDIQTEDVNL